MTPCDVLKLKLVTPEDAKAVKNFIREIFLEKEPLNQYLIRKECKDFRYITRIDLDERINEGLSYIYTTENGEIAALALVGCKEISPPSKQVPNSIYAKLNPFFDWVEEEAKKMTNLSGTDKEACFRVISVHPDWAGNGLAKLLTEKVLATAKSLGCTHINSYCTSAYSTKLFEKYGFKKLFSVKYADYTQNGEVVFVPKKPHTHLNFMRIKL